MMKMISMKLEKIKKDRNKKWSKEEWNRKKGEKNYEKSISEENRKSKMIPKNYYCT